LPHKRRIVLDLTAPPQITLGALSTGSTALVPALVFGPRRIDSNLEIY
jgi:hypothetical protein